MRQSVVVTLCALLVACTGERNRRHDAFTVRDSAGVEIVESRAPLDSGQSGYRLDSVPIVDLGRAEDSTYLTGLLRYSDGRILAFDYPSFAFQIYDASGHLVTRFGRRGSGPGEYLAPQLTRLIEGDSVAVFDPEMARLTIFDSSGKFVRTIPWEGLADGSVLHGPRAILKGHRFLNESPVNDNEFDRGGIRRALFRLTVVDFDGRSRDTIGAFPGIEASYHNIDDRRMRTRLLFGRETLFTPVDTLIAVGNNETYAIDLYTQGGRLARRIRRAHRDIPVTGDDAQRELDRWLASAGNRAAEIRATFERMARSPMMPAYSELLGSDHGEIWARDYPLPKEYGQPRRWSVFDRRGRWLATVAMPAGFGPVWIGAGSVLGNWSDPEGVIHVRVYRILREK